MLVSTIGGFFGTLILFTVVFSLLHYGISKVKNKDGDL